MSELSTTMSALEQSIRKTAEQKAKQEFNQVSDRFNQMTGKKNTYVLWALSAEDQKAFKDILEKMRQDFIARAQDTAVATFVSTYHQLVQQFPDLQQQAYEQGQQEANPNG